MTGPMNGTIPISVTTNTIRGSSIRRRPSFGPQKMVVDPVDGRDPEDDHKEDGQVPDDVPRRGMEEVVDVAERRRDHRRIFPSPYPAANARATNATRRKRAKRNTLIRSLERDIVSIS